MNQNYVNTGLLLAMIGTWTFLGIMGIDGEPINPPTHYCESEETTAYCVDVRDYSDKQDYRCLYDQDNLRKYHSCDNGWKRIPNEVVVVNNNPRGDRIVCNSERCVIT